MLRASARRADPRFRCGEETARTAALPARPAQGKQEEEAQIAPPSFFERLLPRLPSARPGRPQLIPDAAAGGGVLRLVVPLAPRVDGAGGGRGRVIRAGT